jgi:hypothetical protein
VFVRGGVEAGLCLRCARWIPGSTSLRVGRWLRGNSDDDDDDD